VNRRNFFQLLVAAGVATSLPAAELLAAAPAPPPLPAGSPTLSLTRTSTVFDFGYLLGFCVTGRYGDKVVRRAFKVPKDTWENMRPRWRDEMWTIVSDEVKRDLLNE
jgi:hypothetical protein